MAQTLKRCVSIPLLTAASLAFVGEIVIASVTEKLPKLFIEPSHFPTMRIARANKLDQHQNWAIPEDATVLVGDSILEFVDRTPIEDVSIVNRGIRGDTIEGVIERMKPILEADVGRINLMVGINVIQRGAEIDILNERIARLGQLLCASGKTVDWLCVLPINRAIYRREVILRNRRITVDLSRFRAAPSARLRHLSFEGNRAFPAQS